MYSAFDKGAIEGADMFCSTAEKLWETEKTHDSFPTMAGAVLLSLSLIGHGKDHAVHYYANKALNMGTRLGLFDENHPLNKDPRGKMSQDVLTARCHAAWGTFNWNV